MGQEYVSYQLKALYKGTNGYGLIERRHIIKEFISLDDLQKWINEHKDEDFYSGHGVETTLNLASYRVFKIEKIESKKFD